MAFRLDLPLRDEVDETNIDFEVVFFSSFFLSIVSINLGLYSTLSKVLSSCEKVQVL